MYRFLSCPKCKARLRVPADTTQRLFRCGACGFEIAMPSDEPEVLEAIPVEETRIRAAETPTLVHPLEEQEPKPAARAGCFLNTLALTPLVIAALGIPFCRFGSGWIAGVLWGVFGVGLTLVCVRVVRRTRWPWVARLLMALGLTGAGQVILVGALAVSFWLWLHRIDPSDWQDFAPPGGRFHVLVPGKPVQNTTAMQGMPPGFQTYQLELHRQDVVFGISFGDVPLEEWPGTSLQVRFDNSLDGMKANLPGSQVVSQKRIALDGNPGREFHLEIPGRAVIVARVYFVRNRLYVLLIAGSRIQPDSEEVTKFLDSFQPDPLDDKQFPPLRPDQQPPDIEDEDIFPGRTILGRKEHTVEQIAVARDGGTLAAAYEDGAIDLWDLTTKQQRGELKMAQKGHQPFVSWVHLDLSPDGKALAVGTLHGELKLFDTATQNETATLAPVAESHPVDRVAFSPGGRYLASAHRVRPLGQSELRVWEVPARKLVRRIRGWKGQVTALTFAPDGRSLVTGGEDGSIRWHDPLTGAEIRRFQLKKNNPLESLNVTALAFTADGKTLASSHYDHTTRLWDVRTGQDRVVHQLPAAVVALDITANGRFVGTGTFNNQLLVSEAATGKKRWEQPGVALNQTAPARGLAFTPDGKQLVLARQKRVELWDLARMIQATADELAEPKERPAIVEPEPSPGEPPRIEAHTTKDPNAPHGVVALDLSADGKTLVTVGRDRNLRFWDMDTGAKRGEAIVALDVVGLDLNPDGKTAAVALPSTVSLYDAKSGERVDTLTPDAAEIAGAMLDPQVREIVMRRNNGKLPAPAPGTVKVGALAFAPDGKTLAVTYAEHRSGVVELWDVAARKVSRRFVTQGGGGRLAFAPDGKTLATGRDNDPLVRLYDVATGKEYARLSGLEWGVGGMAYSGDGRYLAAISTGAAVVLLWDAKTGQEVHRFKDHMQRLWSVALSRDGKTLATGDMEGTVLIYDTASGKHIGTFADVAASLVFSRDGRTLIAGGGDGWVESWSIANLPRPQPPEAPVAQNKPPLRPLAFGKDLQAVGKVEPFLAVAVDPRAGRALFLGRDRFLRVYSYPEFKPEKAYWLGATAYRATLDRQRGMLYAAVCEVQALKMERDGRVRGPADIYVYDVKKILAGEDLSDHVLRPAAMVPVKAELTHLEATTDDRWIYYLEAADWKGARLGRIDAATRKADRTTTVTDATGAFGLGRDGKTLYIGRTRRDPKVAPQQWQGEIQVFDPATMEVRGSIDVPSKPKEIAVEDELLFFGGEGPLGVVDLRPAKPSVVAHWQGPWFGGRYHVGIAPRRVYIVPNSVPVTIRAFDVPDNAPVPKDRPLEADSVSETDDDSLLGEFTHTEDGKYLLCRTGSILRLAVPGMNRPLPPHQEDAKPPVDPKGLTWRERPMLAAPRRGFVPAVAIASDDTMLALGDGCGRVFVYERASDKLLGIGRSEAGIAYLTFAPKGQKKLISTTLDRGGQIRVTRQGTSIGGAYAFFHDVAGHGLDSVAFTADGRELAGAGGAQSKDVVFWNAETGRVVKTVRGFPDPLTAIALSADGKRVAAGSTVGPVRQANLANPRETRTMTGHTAEVRCVAYGPDGKILASGGVDTTVRLWDADTGKEVRKLRGHTNVVLCLVFSPDGKTLVTGGADGTVRVWDVATGNERGAIPPRRRGAMVYALAFAPDGRTLAAACGAEVRQWEVGAD